MTNASSGQAKHSDDPIFSASLKTESVDKLNLSEKLSLQCISTGTLIS
ncbi:unnamed protein product, partial [marine sediment metagenome]